MPEDPVSAADGAAPRPDTQPAPGSEARARPEPTPEPAGAEPEASPRAAAEPPQAPPAAAEPAAMPPGPGHALPPELEPLLSVLRALASEQPGGSRLQALVQPLRTLFVSLLELYAPTREPAPPGEEKLLGAASRKAFLQLLEITSRTHPVYPDAREFEAESSEGRRQTPHLMHLLALAAALRDYFGDDEPEPPPPSVPPNQTVVYAAVAPGEYVPRSGPLTPTEIRRYAIRQRSYTPPSQARLASPANAPEMEFAPVDAASPAQASPPQAWSEALPAPARHAAPATLPAQGCGCTDVAAAGRKFAPARYDAKGQCVSVLDISCETRWRVRECFKVALCDTLRCVGDGLCDQDGAFVSQPPDLGKCLETFVCSLVKCLPDAICPPPARSACCEPCLPLSCPSRPGAPACDCNYAVGE